MDKNTLETNNNNKAIYLVVILVVFGLLGVVGFLTYNNKTQSTTKNPLKNNETVNSNLNTNKNTTTNDTQKEIVEESGMMKVVEQEEKNEPDVMMMNEKDTESAMDKSREVVIDVTGENYKFLPNTITVKKGQSVTVNFKSTNGFHDFVIDEFNAKTTKVNTGQTTSVTFVADKVGTFEYYCSVGNHRALGMVGKLVVTE